LKISKKMENGGDKYELKVLGVGLPRKGTSSLKVALEKLVLGKCYHMYENLQNDEHNQWIDLFDGKSQNFSKIL
jgi:hypothetical protein